MEEVKRVKLEDANAEFIRLGNEVPAEVVSVVVRKTSLDMFAGVIKRTPVDTGRAKGGWMISINSPSESVQAFRNQTAMGSFTGPNFDRGKAKIDKAPTYCQVWITNNVEYIVVLDQGLFQPKDPGPSKDKRRNRKGKVLVAGGYSIQAPHGMVDLTMQEVLR